MESKLEEGIVCFSERSRRTPHLSASNTFSFAPVGLSYLTQLADLTDAVRARLQQRIDLSAKSLNFMSLFQGKSNVTDFVENIGPNTDITSIDKLATLSPNDITRIKELDLEIAKLKATDVSLEIQKAKGDLSDLVLVLKKISTIADGLAINVESAIVQEIQQYSLKNSQYDELTADIFKTPRFTDLPAEELGAFYEMAKNLAANEAFCVKPYPQIDDICILCRQPLSPLAYKLCATKYFVTFVEIEKRSELLSNSLLANDHSPSRLAYHLCNC